MQTKGILWALMLCIGLTSCHEAEDIINILDKADYQSYLRNESGQDVTVVMRPSRHQNEKDCSWFIPKDGVVEIPNTEQWGLQQRGYESDTVFFRFADGSCVLHYYSTVNYPSDQHLFVPAVNNIFAIGLDIPDSEETWTITRIKPKKYRYEYTIK